MKKIKCVFLSLCLLSLISSVAFTEENLPNIPVYPGAKETQTTSSSSPEGESVTVVAYSTADSFDKVVNFYKEKLPQAIFNSMEQQEEKAAVFTIAGQNNFRMVTVNKETAENITRITITQQK